MHVRRPFTLEFHNITDMKHFFMVLIQMELWPLQLLQWPLALKAMSSILDYSPISMGDCQSCFIP